MKKLVALVAFVWVVGHGVALAETPCCAPKPCIDANHDGICENPNGGKACNQPDELPSDAAGCAESATGSCVGGDAAAPDGCVCLAPGSCVDAEGPISEAACNEAAVDACCRAGACH